MPPERRLSNITPLPRQAFLLLSLEGFSEEEVAFVLGTDVAETRRLADAAGREMAAEIATDVLIIEDETFIAMDLESLVKNLGHNVVGVARTHADAVALAKNKKPGLILADIQLADGSSGLDAVNELLRVFEVPRELMPRVQSSSEVYGETAAGVFDAPIRLGGIAGDQQAALFGQNCFQRGMAKNTYGTGCFLLMNVGPRPVPSHRVAPTMATDDGIGFGPGVRTAEPPQAAASRPSVARVGAV